MKRPPNAPPEDYHLRLGVPRPDPSRLTGRQDLKLLDWLVAALLERGGPMAAEEVAERLEAVGVSAATVLGHRPTGSFLATSRNPRNRVVDRSEHRAPCSDP